MLLCLADEHAFAQDGSTILFVTQPPFGSDFTTINSTFGNHLAHTGAAPRGGDLYIRYPDGSLRNLTAEAGFGLTAGQEIAVREPSVHWSGTKALFSMVVGGTIRNDVTPVYWQIYEVTGLAPGETAAVTRLPQPADYNNVSPLYASDDRILFTSDRPRNGNRALYPQLDEYESAPTNTGLWSMEADGSDLRLLDHAVSGVFTPIVASDGRVLVTRWDHLQRDQQNYDGAPYGAFNYVSENSSQSSGGADETFPEPRSQQTGSPIHGHRINIFLPWQIFEDGTGHETLNHVGRHELSHYFDSSRDGLPEFIPPAGRRTADRLFHLAEDPTQPGTFFATYAPEFQTHSAGQIVGLSGDEDVNPDDMQIDFVTDPISDSPVPEGQVTPEGHPGLFRNPLPLSDGGFVAVRTTDARPDRRTAGALSSRYDFHLVRLEPGAPYFVPGERLISGGISKSISYFDNYGYTQHTYDGVLWELDPVEVRAKARPPVRSNPIPDIEANILEEELGPAGTSALRQFLLDNELALIVSRNVTRRADKQQDFNLKVAGSTTETSEPNSTSAEVAFLQLFQGDLLRGYATFHSGRRPIAVPLHDGLLPELPGAPDGSVRIAADGSFAAFVPSSRALTWQLTNDQGDGIVRERFWVSFSSGEIRVCANCHGLNRTDVVLGEEAPINPPEALRDLLDWWQGNFAPSPEPSPSPTPLPAHAVAGYIRYEGSGLPVGDVEIRIDGPAAYSSSSDASGGFSFTDLSSADWMMAPSKNGDFAGAITSFDAALALRAVVGVEELSHSAALACDVTGNGTLSSLDAARILQLVVGNLSRFPVAEACGSDWLFTPTASDGPRSIMPEISGSTCTTGALAFEPLENDQSGLGFEARLFGDCSGNWTPPAAASLHSALSSGAATDLTIGQPRPRGRRHVELPVWFRPNGVVHSLDVRIELAAGNGPIRFRRVTLPDGIVLHHRRHRGRGVVVALASAAALPSSPIQIGSLVLRRSAAHGRNMRVEAFADDVAVRIDRAR